MESVHTIIIGERINPTGRPRLAEALKSGSLELLAEEARLQAEAGAEVIDVNVGAPGVDEEARLQAEAGAEVIDVNVGAPGVDEEALLPEAVGAVREAVGLRVCADSSSPAALRAALRLYPDIMVNSVTADAACMEELLPAIAESEAVLIGITKDGAGIPATAEERLALAGRIVERASSLGIGPERILLDFLTVPVSTEPQSAPVTLECIRKARAEWGAGTVLGASNISFGLPSRQVVNAAFLAMAIEAGLSAAIVNPLEPGIVQSILASDMLAGRDRMGRRFLKDYRERRRA